MNRRMENAKRQFEMAMRGYEAEQVPGDWQKVHRERAAQWAAILTELRAQQQEPIAYLRDVDGTGSLHPCAKGDAGAFGVARI